MSDMAMLLRGGWLASVGPDDQGQTLSVEHCDALTFMDRILGAGLPSLAMNANVTVCSCPVDGLPGASTEIECSSHNGSPVGANGRGCADHQQSCTQHSRCDNDRQGQRYGKSRQIAFEEHHRAHRERCETGGSEEAKGGREHLDNHEDRPESNQSETGIVDRQKIESEQANEEGDCSNSP
jgi:hypothetical protein